MGSGAGPCGCWPPRQGWRPTLAAFRRALMRAASASTAASSCRSRSTSAAAAAALMASGGPVCVCWPSRGGAKGGPPAATAAASPTCCCKTPTDASTPAPCGMEAAASESCGSMSKGGWEQAERASRQERADCRRLLPPPPHLRPPPRGHCTYAGRMSTKHCLAIDGSGDDRRGPVGLPAAPANESNYRRKSMVQWGFSRSHAEKKGARRASARSNQGPFGGSEQYKRTARDAKLPIEGQGLRKRPDCRSKVHFAVRLSCRTK